MSRRSKASLQAEASALEVAGVVEPDASVPEIQIKKKGNINVSETGQDNDDDIDNSVDDVKDLDSDDDLDLIDWRAKKTTH